MLFMQQKRRKGLITKLNKVARANSKSKAKLNNKLIANFDFTVNKEGINFLIEHKCKR